MTFEYDYKKCKEALRLRDNGLCGYDEEVYEDMEEYIEQIDKNKEEIQICEVLKVVNKELDEIKDVKVKKEKKEKKDEMTDVECANKYIKNFGLDNVKLTSQIPVGVYIWDEMVKLWINGNKFALMDSMNKTETGLSITTAKKHSAVCQILTGALKLDDKFESKILNKSTNELPIKNGNIINLKTLEVRKRIKTDYFSFELDVEYLSNKEKDVSKFKEKEVLNFMSAICNNDKELIEYHKKLWGYMMTGEITDRAFYIFFGEGCNGKSSIVNIFKGIMKNFVAQLSEDAIIKKKASSGATPELMPLLSARCSLLPESDKGDILNVSRIKTITGDDTIKARNLFQNQIEFKTQSKLILPTNFKPDIKNVDDKALFDRLRLIPFNCKFPKTKENTDYIENLQLKFLSDFFTYFCHGACEWYITKDLKPCSIMIKEINEYKEDNNIYLKFVNENYISKTKAFYDELLQPEKPKWRILKSGVYDNFIIWLKVKNDVENRKVGKKDFYKNMKDILVDIKVSSEYFICKSIDTIEKENTIFDSVIPTTLK